MRRFVTITFFALVNLNFIYPQIQLTSPNGGEIWSFGSSHDITWTSGAANVTIDYSINGGVNWTNITSGQPPSGSYPWSIPNKPTTQAKVRVSDGSTLDSNSFFFIKSPQTFVNPVKILPIGNSITSDNFRAEFRFAQDKISYRYNLWDSLRTNNYDVDFIGHKSGGYYQFPDPENNGTPGIKDNEILTMLLTGEVSLGGQFEMQATPGPYLNYYTPDIILLQIGTNGVHETGGTSPTDVENILTLIDLKSQDIWVVLALIIDDADPDSAGYSYDITAFNNNIKSMAQDRINNLGDKIIIVDMQHDAGLNYTIDTTLPFSSGDFYDDVHPNDSGKAKMADLWFQGLQLILPNPATVNPVITSTEVTTAYVGLPYRYDVNASGVGAPNYSLTTAPAGMTINSKTGIIDWPNPIGSSAIVSVTATHPTNSTNSTQTFTINISTAPSLPNNIISYWNLDETGSPASFNDLPGINNALPINATSIDSGIVGNALSFNGTDTKVDVIDDSSLYFQKDESFTFETWVKTTQAGTNEPIFLGKDGGSTSYTLGINTSNKTKFEINDSVHHTYFVEDGPVINDGNWHHVAGQVDRGANQLSIYIDGERYNRVPNTVFDPSSFFSYDPLTLGYYKNDNFFNGKLDEVAIYNRRVPGFELARHYISGLARKGYTDNYVVVSLKAFLQGPYNGTDMNTTLNTNNLIPKNIHPYSSAPYTYGGLERVATYPDGVIDWVLVELRSDPNTVVARRAVFIKNDGSLVEIDPNNDTGLAPADSTGLNYLIFPGVFPGNYYIVIKHRNHLGIMSASVVPLSSTEPATLYDFTSGDGSQFYPGNGSGAKLLKTTPINVWGMMGGDSNSSGIITNSDQDPINSNLNLAGYYDGDTNMSGIVTNSDKDFVNGNINKSSQVPK